MGWPLCKWPAVACIGRAARQKERQRADADADALTTQHRAAIAKCGSTDRPTPLGRTPVICASGPRRRTSKLRTRPLGRAQGPVACAASPPSQAEIAPSNRNAPRRLLHQCRDKEADDTIRTAVYWIVDPRRKATAAIDAPRIGLDTAPSAHTDRPRRLH